MAKPKTASHTVAIPTINLLLRFIAAPLSSSVALLRLRQFVASSERERKRLDASIEEVDRERSIDDRLRLSRQLIQSLLAYGSVATLVDVETVSGARWLAVDRHAESYPALWPWRPQDEVHVTGVEAVEDLPWGLV